jgi:hypothetical protein
MPRSRERGTLRSPMHRPSRPSASYFVICILGVTAAVVWPAACGGSSGTGSGTTDAGQHSLDAPSETTADASAEAFPDVTPSCGPGQSDPGQLRCGAQTCTTPAQVCCYDGSSQPHCANRGACNAPSLACDEDTDCAPSGSYCCTGVVPVEPDGASFGITQGTICTTDPTLCLPMPGVGNSSAEACQIDSECHNSPTGCIPQSCQGQCIHLCEHLPNCL